MLGLNPFLPETQTVQDPWPFCFPDHPWSKSKDDRSLNSGEGGRLATTEHSRGWFLALGLYPYQLSNVGKDPGLPNLVWNNPTRIYKDWGLLKEKNYPGISKSKLLSEELLLTCQAKRQLQSLSLQWGDCSGRTAHHLKYPDSSTCRSVEMRLAILWGENPVAEAILENKW